MRISTFFQRNGYKTESKYQSGVGYTIFAWSGAEYMTGHLLEIIRHPLGGWHIFDTESDPLNESVKRELEENFEVYFVC